MKLIIGLGNIGREYHQTRHNLGFMVLDNFADANQLSWLKKDKFKSLVAEGVLNGQKIILAKPVTLYNLSGEAAQAIAHFYNIALSDVLVVHDELALPFGAIRSRRGGSDAGNNGLKSIISTIGADFARVRIGIANEYLAKSDAADFVLSRFTAPEQGMLPTLKMHAVERIQAFIDGAFDHTTVKAEG